MSRHCPFDTESNDIVTIFRIGNRLKMQGEFGRLLKVAKWFDPARRGALLIERANFVWGPVPGMKEGPNRCFRPGPSFPLSPGVSSSVISAITVSGFCRAACAAGLQPIIN